MPTSPTPAPPNAAASAAPKSKAAPSVPAAPVAPAAPSPAGAAPPAPAKSRCLHDPASRHALRCTRCRSLRCANCCERRTIRLEPTWICPCGGNCVPVPSAATHPTAGIVEDIAESLADPFRPGTRIRFGMSVAVLGLTGILAAMPMLNAMGLVISIIARLYFVAWLLKIVRVTVEKPDRATEWPDLVDPVPDLVFPFVRLIAASALAFAPAVAAFLTLDGTNRPLVIWLLLAAGCAVFPPVLAAVGVFECVSALSPVQFARMIRRSPAHWSVASSWLALAVIVSVADGELWARIPFAGPFGDAFVMLFSAIAFARFLGRVVASLDDQPRAAR